MLSGDRRMKKANGITTATTKMPVYSITSRQPSASTPRDSTGISIAPPAV